MACTHCGQPTAAVSPGQRNIRSKQQNSQCSDCNCLDFFPHPPASPKLAGTRSNSLYLRHSTNFEEVFSLPNPPNTRFQKVELGWHSPQYSETEAKNFSHETKKSKSLSLSVSCFPCSQICLLPPVQTVRSRDPSCFKQRQNEVDRTRLRQTMFHQQGARATVSRRHLERKRPRQEGVRLNLRSCVHAGFVGNGWLTFLRTSWLPPLSQTTDDASAGQNWTITSHKYSTFEHAVAYGYPHVPTVVNVKNGIRPDRLSFRKCWLLWHLRIYWYVRLKCN